MTPAGSVIFLKRLQKAGLFVEFPDHVVDAVRILLHAPPGMLLVVPEGVQFLGRV